MNMQPHTTNALDAVVVGGGIGGLATAIAVRQAGRSVIVLERTPKPSEVDTGITLWPFAVRALRQLGIDDPNHFGAPLERLVNYSARGELLSTIDLAEANHSAGAPGFDVHRAELLRALLERLGVDGVRYGSRCVAVRAQAAAGVADLEDGSAVAGRVLVGADGVHSVVRAHVAPETRIRLGNIGVWRGVLDLDESTVPAGAHFRIYGPGGVFGAARLDARRVRWYAGGRVPETTSGTWDEFRRRFAGWCEPAASVIEAGAARNLLYNQTPRFRPLRSWAEGPVALVGDAAHGALPTLGISGGLALADGAALGAALSRGLDSQAMKAYSRRRRKVGRRIQREAEGFRLVLAPRRQRSVRARDRLLAPPLDWFQSRAVTHLAHGAEASAAAEFLPRLLRPANRRVGRVASQDQTPMPDCGSARHACLIALRRATGIDEGPMELHSLRVERIALRLADLEDHDVDELALRCAALLHDIGLYDPWWDGGPYPQASGQAAQEVLGKVGFASRRLALCRSAVRRHHAPTDQSSLGKEVELLRRADLIDISRGVISFGLPRQWLVDLFDQLPRTGFGRHVAWLFVSRSLATPESARAFFLEIVRQSL